MAKLVVFKIGDGNFERGFPVTLQIGEEGDRPSVEIGGKLPPDRDLPCRYSYWQTTYRSLGLRLRLEAEPGQVTNISIIEDCCGAAQSLRNSLNQWLHAESFRLIREKLLEKLLPSDEVRIVFQAEDFCLHRLPWHLWDLFERYPKAEVAFSPLDFERLERPLSVRGKVRILAILGNSVGIDTQADLALLEQLPDAEISLLLEPQRQELNDRLWRQGWDILFFAGHSSSQANCQSGQIYINQTDSLTINDLKYALRRAIECGLKIAIFNSCDGLGLAKNLAELHIPQLIVMREPVPDVVAQEFLKYFLETFARGQSFYLAVREARERLQGLEGQFPCATWLPVICQNPAEVPLTWHELHGSKNDTADPSASPNRQLPHKCKLRQVFAASLVITCSIMGVRYLGKLQFLELQAFDQMMRLRSDEAPDSRLLVVAVNEKDFQLPEQKSRKGSLSDLALARLLEKLEQDRPRAIGLDIYREDPVPEGASSTRLRSDRDLFVICKVRDREANFPGIAPPPDLPIEHQGFSDVIKDSDDVLRRHLLAMKPDLTSPCITPYALSTRLAFRYLEAEGIHPQYTPKGLQLGKVVLQRLRNHMGGYQQIDDWGYQILLNYRSYRSPMQIASTVTLTDVLTGAVKPDEVRGRIVLIGVTAYEGFHDYMRIPYATGRGSAEEIPGVMVHAQMVSQILSAVKDGRPLLWVWPVWSEVLWVWGWSVVGGILVWRWQSPLYLGLAGGAVLGVLYVVCFGLFTQGRWVPLIPSVLALVVTGSSVLVYPMSQAQQH